MEAPESPGTQNVVGVLSRGEDTDGETSDVEVDYPTESFVSQHDNPAGEEDNAAEFEVTGEGTAGGPFGLKKVLFVRKKSEKNVNAASKDDPKESFKEKVSKLGTGVSERFAALGNMMQDHGNKAGGGIMSSTRPSVSDKPPTEITNYRSASHHSDSSATVQPSITPSGSSDNVPIAAPKRSLEYFQEYEMTFYSKPEFSVIAADPSGKGAMVAWKENSATEISSGAPSEELQNDPPSGAVILIIAGESVVDANLAYIEGLLYSGKPSIADNNASNGDEETPMPAATENGDGAETSPDSGKEAVASNEPYPLVVRFREKTGSRPDGSGGPGAGAPSGEFFRNRVKAMATGFGSLFQVKEASGSAVRDGSDAGSAAGSSASVAGVAISTGPGTLASDSFVLIFGAEDGTAESLPFTLAEMIGGRGVVVSAVLEGYASALIKPAEIGVSAAGTAAVLGDGGVDGDAERKVDVLSPGSVLLRVAGQNVEGKSLAVVEKILEDAATEHLAVKILFRCAPPIYRASVAAELALEAAKTPHMHVGTWQPLLKRRAGVTLGGGGDGENGGTGGGSVIGIGYGGEEWEDVRETMGRALKFVNGFRSAGIRVDVINMQTVTLPRNIKSAYAGNFEGRSTSFQQAVRVWFLFPDERTVSLRRDTSPGIMGLTPVETRGAGTAGSWVTVTAVEGSPCAEAGVPVGENSMLTHVNGYDVSPPAYRSLAPAPFGGGEGWGAAVLPALEGGGERGDRITLTFV